MLTEFLDGCKKPVVKRMVVTVIQMKSWECLGLIDCGSSEWRFDKANGKFRKVA
jgi:hypothetical protein